MSRTSQWSTRRVRVRNATGEIAEFVIRAETVTEHYVDGKTGTWAGRKEVGTSAGEPVNVIEEGLFEDLHGVRWRDVSND